MSTEKLSELSKPMRIHRDWNSASMCHCGKCDRWEMTIADDDGVQTCASCYDAEWLSEWQDYAEAADKRIAELEANELNLIAERDSAENIIAGMYEAATGNRPEWSNWFGFSDAVEEVAQVRAKLTTPIKIVNYDEFFICHVSGASDDYCKGWVDGRNAAARDVEKAGFTVEDK